MQSTRRTITAAVTMTALTISLAACGGGGDDEGSEGNTNGATSGDAGGDGGGDPITLSVATFNEFGYEDLFEEYESLHDNITIEHVKADTADNARDALRNSLGADSGASDIEAVEVDWLVEFMQYPDKFTDLTDPSVEGRWQDWKSDAATTDDGTLLAYGTDNGPEAICYRADLFGEAGLPTDRDEVATLLEGDWQHYFDVGKEFVASSDAAWFDSANATWQGMINQVEVAYQDESGELIATTNPEVKALYDQVLTAAVDDELSAGLGQWSADWNNGFQQSSFATMLCPGWMLGIVEGNAAGIEGWDVANVFPGGAGNWGGSYLTVPAQGDNIEAATALANWLTAPEQQIKAFEAKGTFPSQVDALESEELLSSTNAFFNNAPTGEIFVDRAKAITFQPYKGPDYFSVNTALQDALTRVDVDGTDDATSSWDKFVADVEALG
ncbi:extracellular solute-binding protein [Ornithinimicrobium cryptoxanthini]|uniref:Extracellular solute-binding protein n=2 Tax=Ornithinimicrobium cryptoxanthini TaxID=2934161 RepID=A0ABY4YLB5_9MICO|nr:extracellular solute-binding protein [Ornithinimicrobium cryptoxanthini]USQ77591.1 extracellular solute-binding protein [Ornithinimicrobium cryptoxanthini]